MIKFQAGVYLPEREDYLVRDIEASPQFAGGGTVQFKKFQRAFSMLRQFRHAVDAGSNLGIWARVMARCFAKLTCFEPNSECTEAFWLNVNHPERPVCDVVLHQCALGAESGRLRFNDKQKSTAFTNVDDSGELEAEVRTLDSFELQEVDFIKIDVEGFEYNVVRGAGETIHRCKPVMLLEQKPNNAERYGIGRYAATKLLTKWGAVKVDEISGDVIMIWPKKKW